MSYKGFFLYGEDETLIRDLTDEQRGRVIKAVMSYRHKGNNRQVLSNLKGVEVFVFNYIKARIDRDKAARRKAVNRQKGTVE